MPQQPPQQQRRTTATRTPPPSAAPQQQPVVDKPVIALARVTGTYVVPSEASARLQWAATEANLVSPATSVGVLPEGCAIALNAITVNLQHETYDVGSGKNALAKSALDRIAAAIGVSWIPGECVRVDDGSDPHYCHFRVAGRYRAFDGQVQIITGNKEMDLRDGSPAIVQIEAEVDKHNANPNARYKRDKISQVRQLRSKILEHAETKAKLRATRSLGVRASYTKDELAKPFITARIMFTGQTSDPELRKIFAQENARAFLSGTQQLYGGEAPRHVLGAHGHPPPALGTAKHEVDDDYPQDDDEPAQTERRSEPPAQQQQAAAPSGTANTGTGAPEYVIPGGRNQGTPLHRADDGDLLYWAERIGNELDKGTSRNPDRDAELHQALCDEIALRQAEEDLGDGPMQQELRT